MDQARRSKDLEDHRRHLGGWPHRHDTASEDDDFGAENTRGHGAARTDVVESLRRLESTIFELARPLKYSKTNDFRIAQNRLGQSQRYVRSHWFAALCCSVSPWFVSLIVAMQFMHHSPQRHRGTQRNAIVVLVLFCPFCWYHCYWGLLGDKHCRTANALK